VVVHGSQTLPCVQAMQVISWMSLFVSLLWARSLLKPNCSSANMLFKRQSCTNSLYTTFSDISDNPFTQEMTSNWTCLISFCKQPLKLMHWWCTDYTGSSKKMDGIWSRYNLKSTRRIYTFGILKCSEKFKALGLP